MIEPEIAFADLEDDMDLIEDMVKYCIDYVLENAPEAVSYTHLIDFPSLTAVKEPPAPK